MRKKEQASTVKWSEKNRIYLSRLGFLDARTGKVRKEMNMSGFINNCVTMILEAGKSTQHHVAQPDELRSAWIKYCVAQKYKQIQKLQQEVVELANKKPLAKKYAEALGEAMELPVRFNFEE